MDHLLLRNRIRVFDSKFHIRMYAGLDELKHTHAHNHKHTLIFMWKYVFALLEYVRRQMPYQFVPILNHGLFLFETLNSGVR